MLEYKDWLGNNGKNGKEIVERCSDCNTFAYFTRKGSSRKNRLYECEECLSIIPYKRLREFNDDLEEKKRQHKSV